MNIIKTSHSLKIDGEEAVKFIESLISIDPVNEKYKTSFLLKPDGKIAHWFVILRDDSKLFIYQSLEELSSIKKSLEFYKIRTDCSLEIVEDETKLNLKIEEDTFTFSKTDNHGNYTPWREMSIILELPLPEIISEGLLPNETKWLDVTVDFNKGCFLGQEQASRVKFRGRPRRQLKSIDGSQQFIRI